MQVTEITKPVGKQFQVTLSESELLLIGVLIGGTNEHVTQAIGVNVDVHQMYGALDLASNGKVHDTYVKAGISIRV